MKQTRILSVLVAIATALTMNIFPPAKAADYTAEKSRVSVHDPSVFKDPQSGEYYVFGSHIDAARSSDLQSWTRFTNGYATVNNKLYGNLSQNLSGAFAWAGENLEDCAGGFAVWAPDVIYNPDYINTDGTRGAYLIYFCTSSTYMRSVIAFAVSKSPEGPYTYADELIYSGFTSNDSYATSSTKNVNRKYTSTNIPELIASGQITHNESWFSGTNFNNTLFPNAIDPNIYYGTDGRMYMCYGSWSGGIFTLELDPATGKCIHPKSGTTPDGRMIDSYFGTKISGGYRKSGEGPFIEYNPDNGYYYLWVTYGGLLSDGGYNMRVFRSESPTGPFSDAAGKSAVLESSTNLDSVGLKMMGNYKLGSLSTAYMACGHNSVLRDDDGSWYLFYHARFDDGSEYHEVRVHSMYFSEDGWPVATPYEYSGEQMPDGGYDPASLAGSYELVNHGTDTNATIHSPVSVKLNADGTISGNAVGTWNQAQDSAYLTLTIDGAAYCGYFLAQYDESKSGKRVMTFAASGAGNRTVWGVRTDAYNGSERSTLRDYTESGSKLVYAPDTVTAEESGLFINDTQLFSGVSYYIINKNSGKAVEADTDGNLRQWTKAGGAQREWRFVDLKNGYCKILSCSDESKCAAVAQSSAENGVNIELQTYTGTDSQQWKLIRNGGSYAIVSRCSQDAACMDMYDWSVENGGNVNQWEYWGGDCQLWSITPVYPEIFSGSYSLRNADTGKYLSGGGRLSESDIPQRWSITALGNGRYTLTDAGNSSLSTDESALMLGKMYYEFTIWCGKSGEYSLMTSDGRQISDMRLVIEPYPASGSTGIKGDLDFDGKINAADAALMKRGLLYGFTDTKTQACADVDGSGNVTETDASAHRKFLLGSSRNFD